MVHGTNPIAPQGRAHGHTSGAAPSDLLSAQRPDAGAAPGIGKDDAGYGVDATPGACMVPQPGAGLLPHGITVAPGDLAVDLCAAPLIPPAPVHPACMGFHGRLEALVRAKRMHRLLLHFHIWQLCRLSAKLGDPGMLAFTLGT